ncbi:hypothetical protein Tco_0381165, partial [Tanacetum coccineum]
TTEEKTDTSNALDALDASSVILESKGTESKEQDTSSRSGNDAHVDDADIKPIYNEEPMAEVQMTADDNVSATGQQHTEQPEFNNEGKVDQNAEQCHDIRPLPAKLTDDKTIELSDQSLESENVCLKKIVAQFQKYFGKLEAHCINLELQLQMENNVLKSGQQSQFLKEKGNEAKVKNDIDVIETINIELEHSVAKLLAENEQLHKEKEHLKQTYKDLFDSIKRTRVQTKDQNDSLMAQLNKKSNENADVLAQIQKKGFAIAALKNELRKLTGNSVNTKFAKPSILGKPVGQPLKNQSVVRQPTAFKSERPRISKPRFASQVDVNNDLSKPVTTHHLPKGRESAPAKPHHMIAPSSSRYSSNDIVHNHYLEEAKKKAQEHSRNSRNFSDSKHFVCSTCQKCVFNANHDACVIKFLKEVNSRAKVPSNKTTNRNKPVEQIRVATKPKRQIPKGHRFSIKKTTTVHEKTTSPRSCLRWQPTGRILKTVCLRWVPTGKTFASSTTKVESEPPNGSNADIPNQCESKQALNVSAGTLLSTGSQLTVSILEHKNIKEAMAVLHGSKLCRMNFIQFDRLKVMRTSRQTICKMIIKTKVVMKKQKDEDRLALLAWMLFDFRCPRSTQSFPTLSDGRDNGAFLNGLQIHQSQKVFLSISKYALGNSEKANMDNSFQTLIMPDALDTRKATSGGIQFLGDNSVCWMSKKQNALQSLSKGRRVHGMSICKCAQVMWMRTTTHDYGINYNKNTRLYCDSQSA